MNKVILMGRLTADPELRQTQNGITTVSFTVAVNRPYTDKQSGQRQADFIRCVAWRQTAEFVSKYFRKGSMICAEGELRTGSYQDKKYPDVTHYTTDVMVDKVEFTGEKQGNTQGNYNQQPQQAAPPQAYGYSQPQQAPQSQYGGSYNQTAPPQQYGGGYSQPQQTPPPQAQAAPPPPPQGQQTAPPPNQYGGGYAQAQTAPPPAPDLSAGLMDGFEDLGDVPF